MNYTSLGDGLVASDVVLGRAVSKLLAGELPPAEDCSYCEAARYRGAACWHQAARYLLDVGLITAPSVARRGEARQDAPRSTIW